jgi:hypothetical protein
MGVVESDIGRRAEIALSLDIHISRRGVVDGEHSGRVVKGVALLLEIPATCDGLATDGYGVGREVETQHTDGIVIESGIGNGASTVRDSCDHRKRA